MGTALVTDLYELHMASSYLRRDMVGPATFSLYVRTMPAERGFLVSAGLEDCLSFLESFSFDDGDLAWLAEAGFPARSIEDLGRLRFTGDVWAVPEGRVVLAGEPVLEVTAPLPEAQLVETFLLNRVTFQMALASKAVRCRLAAPDLTLADFSLRRTHGLDGAAAAARAGALAGFSSTSNVDAARRFGLAASGTMAHSYVEAFPTETAAFEAYCADAPGPFTFLVDTYDTRAGVAAAADVICRLRPPGPLAVRIDSGDLATLAFDARRILDAAGLHDVRIVVTGALDEYRLADLVASGAPIDAAGVGTRVGVSADAPTLDSVYKLVEVDGRPTAKRSPGKATLPGAKQVWRRAGQADLLARRDEPGPGGAEPLLVPVLVGGRRREPAPDAPYAVAGARERLEADLEWLPGAARRIRAPQAPLPAISPALGALAASLGVSGAQGV
jgi:nicotinate phosphoribosyltransferase